MQTLIMVPGLLCNERLWRPQVEALQDLAACQVTSAQMHHTSVADIARQILAEAPESFALAGLSFGGYVAFEIMRQAPARVQRLALLDTSARPDTEEATASRRQMLQAVKIGKFIGVTDQLVAGYIHPDRMADAALVAEVKQMTVEVGGKVFARQQQAILSRPDSRPVCAEIQCPTLVLCGEEDTRTPVDRHREMAELIPNAMLQIVPHCGHLSTMERPETVNAHLRQWLTQEVPV